MVAQNPAQLNSETTKSGAESGAARNTQTSAMRKEKPAKHSGNDVSDVFYGFKKWR